MNLNKALEFLPILETHGWNFHYLSCGIYNQGLITTPKSTNDPTRQCTCGRDESIAVIQRSKVFKWLKTLKAR